MDHVGLGESGFDVADFTVQLEQDVVVLVVGERVVVAVQLRRTVGHRLLGIEHRGQQLVLDDHQAGSPPRRRATESASTATTRWPAKRTTLSSM